MKLQWRTEIYLDHQEKWVVHCVVAEAFKTYEEADQFARALEKKLPKELK
jgi:hypothetical protein